MPQDNPGSADDHGKPLRFEIHIDHDNFVVHQATMTGSELRGLPTPPIPNDRDLYEEVPGGADVKIEVGAPVNMRNGLHFFTAPATITPG